MLELVHECTGGRGDNPVRTYSLWAYGHQAGRLQIRQKAASSMHLEEGMETNFAFRIEPEYRNRGYEIKLIALAKNEAFMSLGLDELLIGCEASDVESRHAIEKNGGVELRQFKMGDGRTALIYRISDAGMRWKDLPGWRGIMNAASDPWGKE